MFRYTVSNVEAWQQLGGDIKGAAMMDRFGDTVSLSKVIHRLRDAEKSASSPFDSVCVSARAPCGGASNGPCAQMTKRIRIGRRGWIVVR